METSPVIPDEQDGTVPPITLDTVQTVIQKHFPQLWPAVEAGLATCATLLLADNVNPVALIYVGPAGSGKTTVLNMFEGAKVTGAELMYRSDKFTPAAFVSHSAKASAKDLEKIDLLPRIKHKVLLTPELSTIFRGKQDELVDRFSIITRVLDGQGLKTDSGTQGQRGYEGDYLFAWLGATTPLSDSVWKVMAQLGSRLVFLVLDAREETTLKDLVDANKGDVPYCEGVIECQKVVHQFVEQLFVQHGGVRGMKWTSAENREQVLESIARCAVLVATMRTPFDPNMPAQPESPKRVNSVLYNLARGHALIHGRTFLTEDDLPMIAQITLSSIPDRRRAILLAFVEREGRPLTVAQIAQATRVSRHTAETYMAELEWLGVATFEKDGNGQASHLCLNPDWEWCVRPEFAPLLLARPLIGAEA